MNIIECTIKDNKLNLVLDDDIRNNKSLENTKINYCPICGRKL